MALLESLAAPDNVPLVTRDLLALVCRAAAPFLPLAGSEAMPGLGGMPPDGYSDPRHQHAMAMAELTHRLASMGWLEETEDTEDVAHDAYTLGARIFSMLIAESYLPQLALRCVGEFGPAAGQVAPAPPLPSAVALLAELSSHPVARVRASSL